MTLTLLLALVLAGALGLALWPLLRRRLDTQTEAVSSDIAVYRDQLAELDRDVERGLVAPAEAASARVEIQRRIIAATPAGKRSGGRPAPRAALAAAIVIALPVGALELYARLGSPAIADQPLAARTDRDDDGEGNHEIAQMVDRLAERLKEAPGDVESYVMLGRSYNFQHRYKESADAYREAARLSRDAPEVVAAYGEALVMAQGGMITPEAASVFEKALAREAGNPRALFYLALAREQAGDNKDALDRYQKLAAASPADAPWLSSVRERIRVNSAKLGIAVAEARTAPPAASGGYVPTPSGAEALAAMAPGDRDAFVRGRVEALAERLKGEPRNVEGQLQLARSYSVLGETAKAAAAIAAARAAASGTADAARVEATASELGIGAAKAASAAATSAASTAALPPAAAPPATALHDTSPQQMTMIRGMVDRLEKRLAASGDDVDGWLKLGRSYGVLGEPAKARDAFARAWKLRSDDLELGAEYAESIVAAAGDTVPPEAADIYRRILARDPASPEALWYLGMAASERNDRAGAKELWTRLLAALPAGSDDARELEQRLAELAAPR